MDSCLADRFTSQHPSSALGQNQRLGFGWAQAGDRTPFQRCPAAPSTSLVGDSCGLETHCPLQKPVTCFSAVPYTYFKHIQSWVFGSSFSFAINKKHHASSLRQPVLPWAEQLLHWVVGFPLFSGDSSQNWPQRPSGSEKQHKPQHKIPLE